MKKDSSRKTIPKYFHSDGNGIHLDIGEKYMVIVDKVKYKAWVVDELKYFYLLETEKGYKITINKFQEECSIIKIK
ncbi:MAG: hypothetical protein Q4A42_03235 [Tissierellia bacterium]|nr:hypothetical protein [Tissierellia bacterium]